MDEQRVKEIGSLLTALHYLGMGDDELEGTWDGPDDEFPSIEEMREIWRATAFQATVNLLDADEMPIVMAVSWSISTEEFRQQEANLAMLKKRRPADGSWDEMLTHYEQQIQDAAEQHMKSAPPSPFTDE